MKHIYTFFILTLALSCTFSTHGQECGNGKRTITIFVPNGTAAKHLRYELFSVEPKSIPRESPAETQYVTKTFGIQGTCCGAECGSGYRVDPLLAEKFLNEYDASAFTSVRSDLIASGNRLKSRVSSSKITFTTWETFSMGLLLKISSDNFKPVYLFGNFLGGCYRQENILLTDPY